jgi:ribosomal protein L31E
VGTLLPQVLPPVAKVLAKGGGAVVDALSGRTPDIRANELIRTAANNEVNALRQAMAANPDMPASRAAADLNLPVLQALLARAEQRDPQQVVNAFRQRESQDIVNQLTRIAGGPTAETARAARESAKESLTGLTGPMREKAFAAARETGEAVPKLQTIATEARADVKEAVDRVRRFVPAIDRAEEWAKSWVASGGARAASAGLAPRPPVRYTFPGELMGVAERRAGEAAQESLRAGGRARAAENVLESMRARGIEPIEANKITGRLNGLLRNPEIATNREAATAIPRVVDMVNDWTNEYGVVTPEALYAIRKNAVAGVIRELNPNMDAKSQERFAARVLTQIKPLFDEAIEKAGGKGFRDYLRSVESGMSSIKGMELADQVRKLYATGTPEAKQQIIDLMRGESPEIIEELFGSGRYQISKEMAKDMPFLTQLADTLDLDRKAVQQAAAGRAALTEAEKKGSARVRFPFFTRASTAVNEVVAGLEQRMKAETLDVLIRAAQSGREFNRVLNQIPARERNVFLKQFKNAESWNKFAGQVAQAAQVQVTSRAAKDYQEAPVMMNSLAPSAVNQLRP